MEIKNVRLLQIVNCDEQLDADITAAFERARARGANVHLRHEALTPDWAPDVADFGDDFTPDLEELVEAQRKVMRKQLRRRRKKTNWMRRFINAIS